LESRDTGQDLKEEISRKVLKGQFQDRIYSNHPLIYFYQQTLPLGRMRKTL
jgi:hypothetical protein